MLIILLTKFTEFFRYICRRVEVFIYSLPYPLTPIPCTLRRGQTVIEYMLMLAVVAAIAMMMGILFHKKILGGIFTMVGLIIGAGTPT